MVMIGGSQEDIAASCGAVDLADCGRKYLRYK
jgi:hypothetical protein